MLEGGDVPRYRTSLDMTNDLAVSACQNVRYACNASTSEGTPFLESSDGRPHDSVVSDNTASRNVLGRETYREIKTGAPLIRLMGLIPPVICFSSVTLTVPVSRSTAT